MLNRIEALKIGREEHCKVINRFTAKLITLEECVEDVQKKAFPTVRVEFEYPSLFVDPPFL